MHFRGKMSQECVWNRSRRECDRHVYGGNSGHHVSCVFNKVTSSCRSRFANRDMSRGSILLWIHGGDLKWSSRRFVLLLVKETVVVGVVKNNVEGWTLTV